jgi:hypothetical protein
MMMMIISNRDLRPFFPGYVKGKGKVVPVLNQAPRHEDVLGEWRYSSTHSLTSAVDGDDWSASRPGRFTPREGAPGTHWIGGWVGPRAVLDAVVKRKIPSSRRESNPRTQIVQPVAQRYTDWAITALFPDMYWLHLLEQADHKTMSLDHWEKRILAEKCTLSNIDSLLFYSSQWNWRAAGVAQSV